MRKLSFLLLLLIMMQISHLVALNEKLENDTSIHQIPIFPGHNSIGRDTISLPDKRLSRKHLTVIVSSAGSANLVVVSYNCLSSLICFTKEECFEYGLVFLFDSLVWKP